MRVGTQVSECAWGARQEWGVSTLRAGRGFSSLLRTVEEGGEEEGEEGGGGGRGGRGRGKRGGEGEGRGGKAMKHSTPSRKEKMLKEALQRAGGAAGKGELGRGTWGVAGRGAGGCGGPHLCWATAPQLRGSRAATLPAERLLQPGLRAPPAHTRRARRAA